MISVPVLLCENLDKMRFKSVKPGNIWLVQLTRFLVQTNAAALSITRALDIALSAKNSPKRQKTALSAHLEFQNRREPVGLNRRFASPNALCEPHQTRGSSAILR